MTNCLICGVTKAEVTATRNREGYTLGCGIESNTESGFDYEELSPRHRWAPWRDVDLSRMGIKPEAFDRYRTTMDAGIRYAPCDDTMRGHVPASTDDDLEWADRLGQCIVCGRDTQPTDPSPTNHTIGAER